MKQADLFHPFFMFWTVKKVDFYRIFAVAWDNIWFVTRTAWLR